MSTDNNQQSPTITTKNGVASDDKSKGADFSDSQGSGGGNEVPVSEPEPVTTSHFAAERGGSALDDRAKEFEVFDHPKA
jgi:hypothetical protein